MQVFREDWKGKGRWAPIAAALNRIGRLLNSMEGLNGVQVYSRGGRILIEGAEPPAVGRPSRVFVGGKCFESDVWTGESSGYLAVYFDGETLPAYVSKESFDDAVESGFPDDCEYYDLGRTFGDIHVPRA